MTADWSRLAAKIKTRRRELDLTQAGLAQRAGVSESSVYLVEGGRERKRLPTTMPAIEAALGWDSGSAEAILGGGEPATVASPAAGTVGGGELADGMPLRLRHELRQGHVVDSAVVDRPGAGRFIVVWKTDDAASEPTDEDLAEWSRIHRALHGIDGESSN
ncbi:helix-turn-helix domain-containing protein [Streptomyces sp. DSM 44915]|uniref:Helix-turn-helix domain-containing protein n=1 Tax=Streptomyces chisholmiae TaxID=3075540 RepID=A0ABU2K047_9ACTN|nr:helix-turn-helix domain-containing protein [Streptomyces sp. DSM 44915]MDT0270625.1 helix-turn-helix domain-containing protein [Streptomyces sp. DSM 44915]